MRDKAVYFLSLVSKSFADAQSKQPEKFLSIDIGDDLHIRFTLEMPVPVGDHVTGGDLSERFDAGVDGLRFFNHRFVEHAGHAHRIARIQSNVTVTTVLVLLGEFDKELSDVVEEPTLASVSLREHFLLEHGEGNGGHAGQLERDNA